MTENEIGKEIVDASIRVHRELGQGLLESAYEQALVFELKSRGLKAECQVLIPVWYRGERLDNAFRADIVVNDIVLIELKSAERTTNAHKKQVLTYLRLSGLRLGYLINFGGEILKSGLSRIVNGMPELE